ncbi:MAG: acyl-CoA/acyl-ACP dehydrogenase [Acidimicrobiales bacterium]|nr:acyl-CoA/acyl-ACP dehydrogenase [Acidimicrobiales bacterium]HRW36861.1 acyl-CoA dehydrogenase family protein [Aquihabitans sp.]
MDLEFTDDQLGLRDAARSVLADACPPSLVRSIFDGEASGDELWITLRSLDWPALGVAAEHGGLGAGFVEVGIVVEELGRVVAPGPFLATVTQFAAAVAACGSSFRLADVALGQVTGTLALAERGRWEPAAIACTAEADGARWRLRGTKSHVVDGATAEELVVVARGSAGLGVFAVPGASVSASSPVVVDPTLPAVAVELDDVLVEGERVLLEPGDPAVDAAVARMLDEATAALALSTVATCRAIFEVTLQYAKDRHQFGKPIGSFQAIKHRLADCYLAVERATALAYFAALTVADDDPRRPLAVAMAKSAAGECASLLTRDGLQLHGGIGFTWEHDLHLLLKRAVAGELLFGSATVHRVRLAEQLGLGPDPREGVA